jgi:hypothetical protein
MIDAVVGMDGEVQQALHMEDGGLLPIDVVHGFNVTMTTVQRGGGTSWYPLDEYVVPLIHKIMIWIPIILPVSTVDYVQQDMTDGNDLNVHYGKYMLHCYYILIFKFSYFIYTFFPLQFLHRHSNTNRRTVPGDES